MNTRPSDIETLYPHHYYCGTTTVSRTSHPRSLSPGKDMDVFGVPETLEERSVETLFPEPSRE